MKYNELSVAKQRSRHRRGRGISAGRGKTAGRGTKGQGARKSGGVRPGFEGGQTPLIARLPHLRGFRSYRPKTEVIYTDQLNLVKKTAVDNQGLFETGLLTSPYSVAKLLNRGELKSKKDVKLQAASANAVKSLQKAGGGFAKIVRLPRPKRKTE